MMRSVFGSQPSASSIAPAHAGQLSKRAVATVAFGSWVSLLGAAMTFTPALFQATMHGVSKSLGMSWFNADLYTVANLAPVTLAAGVWWILAGLRDSPLVATVSVYGRLFYMAVTSYLALVAHRVPPALLLFPLVGLVGAVFTARAAPLAPFRLRLTPRGLLLAAFGVYGLFCGYHLAFNLARWDAWQTAIARTMGTHNKAQDPKTAACLAPAIMSLGFSCILLGLQDDDAWAGAAVPPASLMAALWAFEFFTGKTTSHLLTFSVVNLAWVLAFTYTQGIPKLSRAAGAARPAGAPKAQ